MDSTGHEFFKVLLPGFLEKLSIPCGVAENIPQTYNPQMATILSPLREFWHVRIKREGRTLSFTDGWREFAQAHDFAVGFFLVFRYQGNMVFTIKVYGLNGCLKDYNDTASRCLSRSLVTSDDEEEHLVEDENHNMVEEEEEEDCIILEDSPLQSASGTELRPNNL